MGKNIIEVSDVELKDSLEKFKNRISHDEYSRYKSYDHCRKCFFENYNKTEEQRDYDLVTLNLYVFLASYGMLRNSFLMQRDYKFNTGLVKILCKKKI